MSQLTGDGTAPTTTVAPTRSKYKGGWAQGFDAAVVERQFGYSLPQVSWSSRTQHTSSTKPVVQCFLYYMHKIQAVFQPYMFLKLWSKGRTSRRVELTYKMVSLQLADRWAPSWPSDVPPCCGQYDWWQAGISPICYWQPACRHHESMWENHAHMSHGSGDVYIKPKRRCTLEYLAHSLTLSTML